MENELFLYVYRFENYDYLRNKNLFIEKCERVLYSSYKPQLNEKYNQFISFLSSLSTDLCEFYKQNKDLYPELNETMENFEPLSTFYSDLNNNETLTIKEFCDTRVSMIDNYYEKIENIIENIKRLLAILENESGADIKN